MDNVKKIKTSLDRTINLKMDDRNEQRRHNSTYPKGGVLCFADSFVVPKVQFSE